MSATWLPFDAVVLTRQVGRWPEGTPATVVETNPFGDVLLEVDNRLLGVDVPFTDALIDADPSEIRPR